MNSIVKGKNVLITGSSRGIGKAIAFDLSKRGANLFLTARKKDTLKNISNQCKKINPKVKISFLSFNLTNITKIKAFCNKVKSSFGNFDIIINSAGVFPTGKISNIKYEVLKDCFNINVFSPLLICQYFYKDMKKKQWGRIINIGSSSSYSGFSNTSVYCASKHAILGVSRSMFSEWKTDGIRTFSISPGSTKTDMGKKVKNQNYSTFIHPKELAKFIGDILEYDDNMVAEEIRLNRMNLK